MIRYDVAYGALGAMFHVAIGEEQMNAGGFGHIWQVLEVSDKTISASGLDCRRWRFLSACTYHVGYSPVTLQQILVVK